MNKKTRIGAAVRGHWLSITISIAVITTGLLFWKYHKSQDKTPTAQAVPVEVSKPSRKDVPIYLEGLGTVQAFNTVKVTSRVDGQIEKIGFIEGQTVTRGALLAQIDPRPYQAALDQAEAAKAKDQAQLTNAQKDLERYELLAPKNLASKQTVDTQHSLVAQLEAQIKGDEANIATASTELHYASIVSPIPGRTGIRLVDVGNNVHASDTTGIVVVTQVQPISVVFTLPEDDLGTVVTALNAGTVKVTAISRDAGLELDQGTLALIDNEIDQATGTVRLKATFPNSKNTLWPGEFVNIKLLAQIQRNAIVIPSAALQRGPNGTFTYVVKPDSTVEARLLQVGVEGKDSVVVNNGLTDSESVVVSNQYKLQPGSHVRVDSGANGNGNSQAKKT